MDKELSRRDILVGGAATTIGLTFLAQAKAQAAAQTGTIKDDAGTLKALLSAEKKALNAYFQAAGVLDGIARNVAKPEATRKLAATVLAVAGNFYLQHSAHKTQILKVMTDNGISDDTPEPTDMYGAVLVDVANDTNTIVNIITAACDAERNAAVAYIQNVAGLKASANSELLTAIGGVESQHFVVLYSIAKGYVGPSAAFQTECLTAHGTSTDAVDFITMKLPANAKLVVPTAFVALGSQPTASLTALDGFAGFTFKAQG